MNTRTAGHGNGPKSDQAVVLTLRKRYSIVKRGATRSLVAGSRVFGDLLTPNGADPSAQTPGSSGGGGAAEQGTTDNPWQETRAAGPSTHRAQTAPPTAMHHRLSYDFGSGVIVLPDDGDWLGGGVDDVDEDDSEDDYGDTTGLENSQASLDAAVAAPGAGAMERASSSSSSSNGNGNGAEEHAVGGTPGKARHGTYFHHPERRRQTIPGAFPRVAS